ncbi:hypothetical protein ACXYMO_03385 [Arenibacterium sp. CAU 1754]
MTLKFALATLALCITPALGFAEGCSDHNDQVQSCASGSVWDDNLKTCVKQITG